MMISVNSTVNKSMRKSKFTNYNFPSLIILRNQNRITLFHKLETFSKSSLNENNVGFVKVRFGIWVPNRAVLIQMKPSLMRRGVCCRWGGRQKRGKGKLAALDRFINTYSCTSDGCRFWTTCFCFITQDVSARHNLYSIYCVYNDRRTRYKHNPLKAITLL